MLDPVIQDIRQLLLVFRTDGENLRTEAWRPDMHRLDRTDQCPPMWQLNNELQRLACLDIQPAFDPEAGLADVQHRAWRRQRSTLEAAVSADFHARMFSFESHWRTR